MVQSPTNNLTLCILAAGLGSRYGGLKQIDGFGPNGEALLEYGIYDAIQAWFKKVVIVIKKDIDEVFRKKFENTFWDKIDIQIAYQDLDISMYGHQTPTDRIKPRWTGHAVMTGAQYIDGPFVVVSADDYYGPHMMQLIADNINTMPKNGGYIDCYHLGNTLSKYGWVNRWVCTIQDNILVSIQEHLKITQHADGSIQDQDGVWLYTDTLVNMLSYCFQWWFYQIVKQEFQKFLDSKPWLTDEFFITKVVEHMIKEDQAIFKALISPDHRVGVTNPDDKMPVQQHFSKLVQQGIYPSPLRKSHQK